MFNYFKQRFSKKNKQKANSAFTLAELLVASAISAVVLGIAYSLVNVILSSNKSDNTTIGLNTKIENALDFVVDEVKVVRMLFQAGVEFQQGVGDQVENLF